MILADEINRKPAGRAGRGCSKRWRSRQVTVAGSTHKLPDVYLVLATQNPIEQEGTYPPPELQMDRFLLKVVVRYPTDDDEGKILRLSGGEDAGSVQKEDAKSCCNKWCSMLVARC